MATKYLQITKCSAGFLKNAQTLNNCLIRLMSSASGSGKVGFIGLGNMGNHMATNLLKKVNILLVSNHSLSEHFLFT